MDALVEVADLHKTFFLGRKRVPVLRGVDFSVKRGEMVAVEGPSGAGKSTLLHILGTLDRPSRGRIAIDGKPTAGLPPDELASFRNRTIGFVFQFHHLLPEFTALENTMMPALIQRTARKEAAVRAAEILREVGLADRMDHRPVELSGGEQQRVALARALILRPKLLLADEPTGNLDEKTAEGIHGLLFELNRQLEMTTLVVTHSPRLAERMNRRLRLIEGHVEEIR
ncbi:MAG: ABC transporter ATP-binding protein [Deltaproteobacteria bacterium]|nr:ABC transporter ATP-binding protein [Deltaproteobacteria bacterium]